MLLHDLLLHAEAAPGRCQGRLQSQQVCRNYHCSIHVPLQGRLTAPSQLRGGTAVVRYQRIPSHFTALTTLQSETPPASAASRSEMPPESSSQEEVTVGSGGWITAEGRGAVGTEGGKKERGREDYG